MSEENRRKSEIFNDVFKSEKREAASDVVVKFIKKLLITKQIAPGDKLPSENELANMLNVSRGSVREAMKILTAYGIVNIKRGDGTYIADTTDGILFDPLLFKLIINSGDIHELKQLREMIESGIINLAIKNATEKDIKVLENIYNYTAIKISLGEYHEDVLVETELMFHAALGHATGNKLIQTIYNFVMDLYVPNIYKHEGFAKHGEEALKSHRPIIDSIINRDFEAGEKAIRYSVDVWKSLNENND